MLPAPGFHHLHLNSVDPEAAIGFYTRQFPSSSRTEWGGFPALAAPNEVLILFTKVDRPPPVEPQSAIWHFGWHVPDSRRTLETFKSRAEVEMLPLYTGDGEGAVYISSDTWPGAGGVLGRTEAQIAEAKATGVEPTRVGGFAYMRGPDNALVEFAGNHPKERFNHIHMWQEDPVAAQRWYHEHLGAALNPAFSAAAEGSLPRGPDRTFPALDRRGTYRTPRAGVQFGDVGVFWYANQGSEPLAGSLGQLQDHIGLAVADLEAWIAKLKGEGVRFLADAYRLGDTRAALIEGPSREAIELVEAR